MGKEVSIRLSMVVSDNDEIRYEWKDDAVSDDVFALYLYTSIYEVV